MTSADIAIATFRPEGILRVVSAHLPHVEGIRYIVSWQEHQNSPVPAELLRDDITVSRFDKSGQALNRNNAFSLCKAEWTIPADDDLVYNKDSLGNLLSVLSELDRADVAVFQSSNPFNKTYPKSMVNISWPLPKGLFVSTFEIAFKTKTGLRCCPELGLNSPKLNGAEDEALYLTAIKRGLEAVFIPLVVFGHPSASTGFKSNPTAGNIRAAGCFLALGWPRSVFVRIPLRAWRMWKGGKGGFFLTLLHLCEGALMSIGVKKRNKDYLW